MIRNGRDGRARALEFNGRRDGVVARLVSGRRASYPPSLLTPYPLPCLFSACKQVTRMRELTACRHFTHSLIHSVRPSVRPSALNSTRSLTRTLSVVDRGGDRAAAPRPSQSHNCRGGHPWRETERGLQPDARPRPDEDCGARVREGGREEDVMYVASSPSIFFSTSLSSFLFHFPLCLKS